MQQKWYVIESQTAKGKYNQNNYIKFETESIKLSLCDYFDAFVLVSGDVKVTADDDTDVAFKICAPFSTCIKQKLMMCLLIKQAMFTLQCLCTIWLNIAIII